MSTLLKELTISSYYFKFLSKIMLLSLFKLAY